MIALYIALSVLLFLFLVALIPVSLTLKYKDEVELTASVWAIRIPLYPRKKKKVKISDYSHKKLEKRKKKALKKRLKTQKKLEGNQKAAKAAPQKEKKPILESLELIYELLKTYITQTVKYVKIKTTRIVINVATDDAAKTAMLYAAVSNSEAVILTLLDNCKKLKNAPQATVAVNADFLSEKCSADIELSFTMRVWHLAKTLFVTAFKYVTQKSK